MTTPSSAGSSNPEARSTLWLSVVALAALAVALLLAFVSEPRQRPVANHDAAVQPIPQPRATTAIPTSAPPEIATIVRPGPTPGAPSLWTLLTPWTLRVDALAGLGLALVVALRSVTAYRRRTR